MGEVIQFPGFDERACRDLEVAFEQVMLGNGMPREAIEWILSDIRPRILAGAKSTTFTMSDVPPAAIEPVQKAVAEVSTFLRKVATDLMGQMFLLEAELYSAKFGNGPSPSMPPKRPA
jgi:hypothetical protein